MPEEVYDALKHNKRFASMQQGRQEDAQEFLGFFLETLHEELILALERLSSNDGFQPALSRKTSEDGWLEVGMKGRTATTRRVRSITSLVFGPLACTEWFMTSPTFENLL